jgi:hypothetical protein
VRNGRRALAAHVGGRRVGRGQAADSHHFRHLNGGKRQFGGRACHKARPCVGGTHDEGHPTGFLSMQSHLQNATGWHSACAILSAASALVTFFPGCQAVAGTCAARCMAQGPVHPVHGKRALNSRCERTAHRQKEGPRGEVGAGRTAADCL